MTVISEEPKFMKDWDKTEEHWLILVLQFARIHKLGNTICQGVAPIST